ncbi:NADPH-dependent ferric siderophore reductase [Microbacterium resistens]|uniref:NADPH-dependent ferric siderophore reductase n=1 Tax=Microbacterium resistens TaxID=156977 RepID=A0ABU1SCW7_9MICO|nr:siderophore-interacting protein [Microbacterium resistens]MDR6866767.1 NADPH-dependent ferric siderophore reductase [Microbacterium resistens]
MSHPYRTYRTTVSRLTPLTPSFTRITLSGEDLRWFGTDGLDQRIKVMIPFADGSFTDVGQFDETQSMTDWYRRWRELPDALRNAIRTYTIRAVRPAEREIDIDFVLHGTEGPASAWASAAKVGDPLAIVGPDSRVDGHDGGIEWHPGHADTLLIAGDETAVPAICAIVESLPADARGVVLAEVPTEADALPLTSPDGVTVTWLARGSAAHGVRLSAAVHAWGQERAARRAAGRSAGSGSMGAGSVGAGSVGAGSVGAATSTAVVEDFAEPDEDEVLWEVPESAVGGEYAWLAGEAGTITALRRHLVRDLGIDRRSIAFMGYWRHGRAEA